MTDNRTRVRRAKRTLDHYAFLGGSDDSAEAVTDLVADLGHFCIENDLTYLHLVANGISHWRMEMTDPDSLDVPSVTIHINESNSNA